MFKTAKDLACVSMCCIIMYSLKHMFLITGMLKKHVVSASEWIVPGRSFPYRETNANMSLLVYCDTVIISHIYSLWHWNLCYIKYCGPYTLG